MLKIGDKVILKNRIWDDGQEHHLPGALGEKGDIVIIREIYDKSTAPSTYNLILGVSHEDITDNSFRVSYDEIKVA